MIRYRVMTEADIPAGLRLCRAAGWNQVEDDWRIFLDANPAGSRVAERAGEVVGTVATLSFGGRFTWISMVLVDPAARQHGIGTALLERALEIVGPDACARLDATPAGQPLYERLGFRGEFEISRMTATLDAAPSPATVRPLSAGDLDGAARLDLKSFGADRSFLLRKLALRAPRYAWAAEAGYSLGRPGFLYDQVGPLVAADAETARALAAACLARAAGRKVAIDAPRLDPAWLRWLEARGFREERRLLRMSRGENRHSVRPGAMYAIAGPELG